MSRALPDPRNANLWVHVGGRLVERAEAKVSVFDSSVQGGDACWEGLRVYDGRVFALDRHLDRLFASAHALAFEQVPSRAEVEAAIFDTLKANGMRDGVHIRLTLTRGEKVTSGMSPALNQSGPCLIVLAEWKPPVYDRRGIRLVTSSWRRNPPQCLDSKIHHNNLLNNILAKIEANHAGVDDAVMLDVEGYVAETNATNLFLVGARRPGDAGCRSLPARHHARHRARDRGRRRHRRGRAPRLAHRALHRRRGVRDRHHGRAHAGARDRRAHDRRRRDRSAHGAPAGPVRRADRARGPPDSSLIKDDESMSWVTVIWSMIASACLTLGAIHWLVWYRNRTAWAHLLFSATAASTAAFTFCELRLMRVQTPGELLHALNWGHVALLFWFVSIIWFVRLYLGAGRLWLAWALTVIRVLYLLPSFWYGTSVNLREVTSLRSISFLGDSVTIFKGIPNPWNLFGFATTVMILIFVADASVTAWRRGDRRKALTIGGSVEFFLVTGTIESVLIFWANLPMPILLSPLYLGIVAVMGYEVSRDVIRASQLVHELQASEAGLRESEARIGLLRQEIAHAGRVSMMGQLASGLAHEINQPLASILRNAEAAELFLQHPSPDLDEIRAILSDIRSDDERAGDVIDRMRGLLKRQTLDAGRLDVSALVGDVAALVRIDAATRQVKLDIDVPAGLPHVRGDRVQIQQVLLNLILNGMDALHGTRLEDRRVDVTARLDGAQLIEITVGDVGHGIPADKLARIFDPFFTTKPNGLGIGLAVSRRIVEAHSGRLWAENRNGGGAAFRFTLPIAEEGAAG